MESIQSTSASEITSSMSRLQVRTVVSRVAWKSRISCNSSHRSAQPDSWLYQALEVALTFSPIRCCTIITDLLSLSISCRRRLRIARAWLSAQIEARLILVTIVPITRLSITRKLRQGWRIHWRASTIYISTNRFANRVLRGKSKRLTQWLCALSVVSSRSQRRRPTLLGMPRLSGKIQSLL